MRHPDFPSKCEALNFSQRDINTLKSGIKCINMSRFQMIWKEKVLEGTAIWRKLLSLLLVVNATSLSALVVCEFLPTNLIMIYMLAVVVTAVYLGRGPAILSDLAGVLAFDLAALLGGTQAGRRADADPTR
jgi:K+-sensing histidine kinase KdpD